MRFLRYLFLPNYKKYEGVRPIHIYLLRVIYFLMFALMSLNAWTMIFTDDGNSDRFFAMAICVWAAYGTLAFFGLFKPLRWLPIVLFMIFYKTLWLIIVAFPLWRTGELAGSSAEEMIYTFLPAPFFLFVIPWGYVFRRFLFSPKDSEKAADVGFEPTT